MTTAGGSDVLFRVSGGQISLSAVDELVDVARRRGDVEVARVGPTGAPALEPLVLVTANETTGFYPRCSTEDVRSLCSELDAADPDFSDAAYSVSHEGTTGLPTPSGGPLGVGTRRALGPCGWLRPGSVADYRTYADELVRTESDLLATVADAGLLGRGRGDARTDQPVAEDWRTAADADGEPVVVVNANETDQRVRADQLLLESAPMAVVDPAVALAESVGATDVVVAVPETEAFAQRRAKTAATAYEDATDADPSIQVVETPAEFKAGEMTMVLEALEGNDRIEARRRPPGPAAYGLHGRPTLVHTPRTLAQVGALVREGTTGADDDPGTRLVTVCGDVTTSATVEVPTDASLSVVEDAVTVEGTRKAACVGGTFGGFTPTLDVQATAGALASETLGTNGAVELLTEDRCILATAGERARFAHENNCGRCVPCREGSKQLTELLRDVYDGSYDREMIDELTRVMESTSLCDFGVTAARPAATALEHFADEFAAHAGGECLSGACHDHQEVHA